MLESIFNHSKRGLTRGIIMAFLLYHVDLSCERCRVRAIFNGISVAELQASGARPTRFAPPLNLFLADGGNSMRVEVVPFVDEDGKPDFRTVNVQAVVREYHKGEAVAPGEGVITIELEIMRELESRLAEADSRGEELGVPQIFESRFDSRGPDFRNEIFAMVPILDTDLLRTYAGMLRDRLNSGDVAGVLAAMDVKLRAYSIAYEHDIGELRASLEHVLRSEYLPGRLAMDFDIEDIELVGHAGGRVWEIQRGKGEPFLQTLPDADGAAMQMRVFVGQHEGGICVVR